MLTKAAQALLYCPEKPLLSTKICRSNLCLTIQPRREFSLEFKPKKDSDKIEQGQERRKLPDPRGFFRKFFDFLWMTPTQRMLMAIRNNAVYRFKSLFGLQPAKQTWFSSLFGKGQSAD